MKRNSKYRATKIGAIFAGICLLLTITVLVPVFSVLLGAGIQNFIQLVVNQTSKPSVIVSTIIILFVLLLLSLFYTFSFFKGKKLKNIQVVWIMLVQYLIIQPLGFYLLWATYLNFENDGQIMFAAVVSHPICSLWFIPLGYWLDRIQN